MTINDADIKAAAALLEQHDDYRVLRRIPLSAQWELPGGRPPSRRGLFVDVETTGLDVETDEIIEVALLPFDYDPGSGELLAVHEHQALDDLRDPGIPIPAVSTQVNGITDDMVRGKTIDEDRLIKLVDEADLIIAHNAGFDRPVLERYWPGFKDKPWACSLTDIDWRAEGFGAGKLDYLLMQQGWFYDGHRALNDCLAGLFLLNHQLPISGTLAMTALLQSARKPRYMIRAVGSPFDSKNDLKRRGYTWDPGTEDREKCWWVLVEDADSELKWLFDNVFGKPVQLPVKPVDARLRFSNRMISIMMT
jgi:DNA polymerase-3 subunit epsilon